MSWSANERISRPAPHTPTVAPSSSENRTYVCHQGRGHGMIAVELQRSCRIARGRWVLRQDLGHQAREHAMSVPARVGGEHADGGEALLLLAHALERLVAARGQQQREPGELAVVVEQVAPEDLAQVIGRTALLYRRRREDPTIVFPSEDGR